MTDNFSRIFSAEPKVSCEKYRIEYTETNNCIEVNKYNQNQSTETTFQVCGCVAGF